MTQNNNSSVSDCISIAESPLKCYKVSITWTTSPHLDWSFPLRVLEESMSLSNYVSKHANVPYKNYGTLSVYLRRWNFTRSFALIYISTLNNLSSFYPDFCLYDYITNYKLTSHCEISDSKSSDNRFDAMEVSWRSWDTRVNFCTCVGRDGNGVWKV